MPPRRPAVWVERDALNARLSSDHAVVVVSGPGRSGKSSLLATWSDTQADVVWMEDDVVPDLEHGVLVVDDADRLSAQAWDELGRRIDRHPGLRVRLALTAVGRLPDGWEVEVVTDLYFTLAEIETYLELAGSSVEPRLVAHATAGHPGSVRELARPEVRSASDFDAVLAWVGAARRLPETEKLLAVPDHLTEEIVASLGGPPTFLDHAFQQGLGTWTGGTARPVFALIPTVREATRATVTIDPARRREIRAGAAATFLRYDAPFAAFVEAVHADDLELADAALKCGGLTLIVEHGYSIGALLRPLSVNRLRRFPVLALALALVLNARRQHRIRAIELFGVVVIGARLGSGRPVDRALMRVVESVALRVIGAGDGGVAAARRATTVFRSADTDDLESLGRLVAPLHAHGAISLLYGSCHDEAREQFELALGAAPEVGTELISIGGLAMLDAMDGESDSAERWLARAAERVWPEERLNEYAGSLLRMAQAQVAIDALDFDEASAALDTIWPIVDTIEHWPLMAHLRALIDIGTGQGQIGLERFRSLRRMRAGRLGPSASVRRRLAITESLLLLAVGQPLEARDLVADTTQEVDTQLAALRVALVLGDTEQALALLVRIVPGAPRERVDRLALEAVLLHQMDGHQASSGVVAKAIALAATHRLRSSFMLLPPGTLQLFGQAGDGVPEGLLPGAAAAPLLTAREHIVLRELARTSRIELIAAQLHVSANTVKSQRRSLYRKLGVHSREQALAEALRHGLLGD